MILSQLTLSINDMNIFEKKKELTIKTAFTGNTWYDWYNWLIKYILKHLKKKKNVGGVTDQTMSLFKTKDYNKTKSVRTLYGGIKKQSEVKRIKSIKTFLN